MVIISIIQMNDFEVLTVILKLIIAVKMVI